MANESQETDEKKWPPDVEHIFIEIMLEVQIKGNMPNDVFKGSTWASITRELDQRTGKYFITKQVQQKHNMLRLKQQKWSQLLRYTRLGWDEQTQAMTCSDEVWQNVIAICLLLLINYITYCNFLFMQFASKLVIYELLCLVC